MRNMRTKANAAMVLLCGIVGLGGGLMAMFGPGSDAEIDRVNSLLSGFSVGVGAVLVIAGVVFLIRWRGKTDAEVAATQKQFYDERFKAVQAQAFRLSGLISACFLLVCAVVFVFRNDLVGSWLFIIGSLITTLGGRLLTAWLLRRA